jgi:hypothetical protein
MNTVPLTRTPVQQVLYDRPYMPWRYMPLAAFLCIREYSTQMRDRIIDNLSEGGCPEALALAGILEPEDLDGATAALESGRAWWEEYRSRVRFASDAPVYLPPESDDDDEAEIIEEQDEDEDTGVFPPVEIDPDDLPDPPDPPRRRHLLTTEDVEPFHPGFDPAEVQKQRDWYASRPGFDAWLASQGGPR